MHPYTQSKLTGEIRRYLIKVAGDKMTGIDGASCRNVARKVNKKFNLSVCPATVNIWLNKVFGNPRRARKIFLFQEKDRNKRIEFWNTIISN